MEALRVEDVIAGMDQLVVFRLDEEPDRASQRQAERKDESLLDLHHESAPNCLIAGKVCSIASQIVATGRRRTTLFTMDSRGTGPK